MKPIRILKLAVLLSMLLPLAAGADSWKNESGKGRPDKPSFHRYDRDHGRGHDDRGPERYRDHGDYRGHHGYREHPSDRGRRYGHCKRDGRDYDYHGHWRSWEEWDRYARRYPHLYRYGRYYREHSHLMFSFCDPGAGPCFYFSIGR